MKPHLFCKFLLDFFSHVPVLLGIHSARHPGRQAAHASEAVTNHPRDKIWEANPPQVKIRATNQETSFGAAIALESPQEKDVLLNRRHTLHRGHSVQMITSESDAPAIRTCTYSTLKMKKWFHPPF